LLGVADTRTETGIAPRLCLLAWLLIPLLTADLAAEPIFSKSRKFRIPFQYDVEELEQLGAKEIQLFVSRDQGENWSQRETVAPDAEKFTFTAREEGEYWFSVRTVATGGLTYPAGPHQPELQVIVDLTPPVLELTVEEAEPGQVRLIWDASDEHLDLSTLKLEFREADTEEWQTVHIRPEKQGRTTWTAGQSGRLVVRGSVVDLAGNETRTQADAVVSVPAGASDDREQPVPADESEESVMPMEPAADADPDPSDMAESAPVKREDPDAPPMVNPAPSKSSPPPDGSSDTSSPDRSPKTNPQRTKPPLTPIPGTPDGEKNGPSGDTPPARQSPSEEDASQQEPPQRLEQPANVRLVNSDTFHIGYKMEDVGPSGVGRVDLYITENGGERWFHYGHDPDKTSPFRVKVPRDGAYGFSFRITNGVGLVAIPPQPGEAPEITIIVDRVPPQAQLFPVRRLDAPQGTIRLLIEWTASDRQLADRPISLYYASRSTGPWERIAERLPDTGRFEWDVPPDVDQKVYVRLEVRDAAGNVARVDADEPYVIDRTKPRARITDVEPLKAN
jgi:hypothetical protein